MEDKLLKIINHYGVDKQLKHFNGEVFELSEAIINCRLLDLINDGDPNLSHNRNCFKKNIAEEIADCMVMLEQFKLYYGISSKDITKIFWEKVDRQLDRIDKEDKEC